MMTEHRVTRRLAMTRLIQKASVALAGLALCALAPPAQSTVGGTVLEATSRAPIEGVRVTIEGSTRGTMTDNRGRFVIANLTGTDVILRVNRIGFRALRQTVKVGPTDLVLPWSRALCRSTRR